MLTPDLLFRRVNVIDGSGGPAFIADVAVKDDRIQAVGDLAGAKAAREIGGQGLTLTPGFVDMHGHSDYFLLVLPSAESKLKQGITTEVGGNCGYSAAPVRGDVAEDRKTSHRELYNLDIDWTDFGPYLERLGRAQPAINFAPLVGFNTVRGSIGHFKAQPPTTEQMNLMKDLVAESLDAGAFGMSLGLIYSPGAFAGVGEIAELAQLVAQANGFVSSHIRSEGERLIEAIEESIEIAERSGARFQISHLKTSGLRNWGKLARVFDLVEAAQDRGAHLCADRYPYLASFTQLSAALPAWVMEGGREAFFARLEDPAARDQMRADLADVDQDHWENIVVSQVFDEQESRFESMSVTEGAKVMNLDAIDFICWLCLKAKDRVAAVYHTMSKGNLERIYKKDWVMIGSDAAVRTHQGFLSEGKPHPRAYGTMPRVIAWIVNELKWLDLPTAVRKMSHDPCQMAGIKDRGLIKEGCFADLVLLDPARAKDTATYELPQQYPEGIHAVVVNGTIAVENGQLTGARNGRVLRRNA